MPVVRRLLLTAALLTSVAACTRVEGVSSCAYRVTYEGRSYGDVSNVDFTAGERVGTAVLPPCDPEGGDSGQRLAAYAVEGTDPSIALAVGHEPDDLTYVETLSQQ
ncbi:DUF6281 family protein [Streptomyces sp. NPDC091279]|uniref:DUF6281 family protein n=1 Tax=unclassified Streptomyces TaxID=2593676 RepID=UPI00380FE3F5